MKKFIKNNKFLLITLIILLIVIFSILLIVFLSLNNNKDNEDIILNGYYYEDVLKTEYGQNIYYFDSDGICFIKQKSAVPGDFSTLVISEKYTYCSYELKKDKIFLRIYDSNEYNKIIDERTFSLKNIEGGIKLDDKVFLNKNVESTSDYNLENFYDNFSLTCASNVAKKLGISNYCTTWKKVNDGFYNYSCGNIIRVFVEDTYISYDTYNPNSGQYSPKGYCYKIVNDTENEINISKKLISKELPIKIIPTGKLSDDYIIEKMDSNIDYITITGYEYLLNDIDKFSIEIDVNNLKQDKEFIVKLNKPIYSKSIDKEEVIISVHTGQIKKKELLYDANNITMLNVNKGLKVFLVEQLGSINAIIKGTDKTLSKLENPKIYVDLSDYNIPGIYDISLKLDLDENIYDYTISPSKIRIKIS